MQDALFPLADDQIAPAPARKTRARGVQPCPQDEALNSLAARLPQRLHLGTSSWSYPGWAGLVWSQARPEAILSKEGLSAYAQHPLMRAVCIDRSFYRALTAAQYERYAAQVPEHFRFTVKAPSLVTDALVRGEDGRGKQANPAFLNAALAIQEFIEPALQGLGAKAGALVFQLSPLPVSMRERMPDLLRELEAFLQALPSLKARAPDGVIAVEVRDPEFLVPEFAEVLRAAGATYCLGLHAKMPPLADQLPMLRALWPGPLVCRWNLHPRHGPFGHEQANKVYQPFDRLVDPDPETHAALARVIRATTAAGHKAYVTISNEAEGCAPLSVRALAQAVMARDEAQG